MQRLAFRNLLKSFRLFNGNLPQLKTTRVTWRSFLCFTHAMLLPESWSSCAWNRSESEKTVLSFISKLIPFSTGRTAKLDIRCRRTCKVVSIRDRLYSDSLKGIIKTKLKPSQEIKSGRGKNIGNLFHNASRVLLILWFVVSVSLYAETDYFQITSHCSRKKIFSQEIKREIGFFEDSVLVFQGQEAMTSEHHWKLLSYRRTFPSLCHRSPTRTA